MSEQSADDDDRLPTPCPQCETTLETKGDCLIHMLKHVGDSNGA
jgi:hypothetical protein